MRIAPGLLPALLLVALAAPPAAAQTAAPAPKSLGKFEKFQAFEFADPAGKVCYLTAEPAKSESKPEGAKRGDVRLTVSHRPAQKSRDELSFQAGYAPAGDKRVVATVDQTKFFEFGRSVATAPETRWTRDADMDKALVAALRAGKELVIAGTSPRGTRTTDTFALAGFARALDAINKACSVR